MVPRVCYCFYITFWHKHRRKCAFQFFLSPEFYNTFCYRKAALFIVTIRREEEKAAMPKYSWCGWGNNGELALTGLSWSPKSDIWRVIKSGKLAKYTQVRNGCFRANFGFIGTEQPRFTSALLNDSRWKRHFYYAMWHKRVVDSNKIYITSFTSLLKRLLTCGSI